MDYISFDKAKLTAFKKEYETALNGGKESFSFEGKEVLTSYAKYVIEYLETKLK